MRKPLNLRLGMALARYLARPRSTRPGPGVLPSAAELARALIPGDVLLVDGDSKFSIAIKYLTQSIWSHSALYVGPVGGVDTGGSDAKMLVEADAVAGVILVPLTKYAGYRTRICRARALSAEDRMQLIDYACSRLGDTYDLRNVVDLARYLIATPPVPARRRRRMHPLGSGDPPRADCRTLIAQAFQAVGYPILPDVDTIPNGECDDCVDEILHIRHHSLYAPRDFDLSPFFDVVKPVLARHADYRAIHGRQPPAAPVGVIAVGCS